MRDQIEWRFANYLFRNKQGWSSRHLNGLNKRSSSQTDFKEQRHVATPQQILCKQYKKEKDGSRKVSRILDSLEHLSTILIVLSFDTIITIHGQRSSRYIGQL
ncbi:hypothetical protein ACOSQ4_014023 [Xanthoceras sorbifolium]